MSDSITSCTLRKNSDGTIQIYDVTFSFDNMNIPLALNTVSVESSLLSNPNDLNEVKLLACQQAKAIKESYSNVVVITDLTGPVTL